MQRSYLPHLEMPAPIGSAKCWQCQLARRLTARNSRALWRESEKSWHQSASLHGYAGCSISGTRYASEMGI